MLECEENKYVQYDFSKFNIEHILNDDSVEDIRYSLGNLLLCPEELNSVMKDALYIQKRKKLLESGIPYLVEFGEKYEDFNESHIVDRTTEIVEKLKRLYIISEDELKERFSKLKMYFDLKEQLGIAFGMDSGYIKELEKRGIEKFIQYIYKNGSLPNEEVDTIKKIMLKNAS